MCSAATKRSDAELPTCGGPVVSAGVQDSRSALESKTSSGPLDLLGVVILLPFPLGIAET